jgi:hypothetical protein
MTATGGTTMRISFILITAFALALPISAQAGSKDGGGSKVGTATGGSSGAGSAPLPVPIGGVPGGASSSVTSTKPVVTKRQLNSKVMKKMDSTQETIQQNMK